MASPSSSVSVPRGCSLSFETLKSAGMDSFFLDENRKCRICHQLPIHHSKAQEESSSDSPASSASSASEHKFPNADSPYETYTCVTGEKVRIQGLPSSLRLQVGEAACPSNPSILSPSTPTVFPSSAFSFLLDPLSHEYMKHPVVVNGNLYDESGIIKWLRTSDVDPLTGVHLPTGTPIRKWPMMRLLLLSLEPNGDSVIFHSQLLTVRLAHLLGSVSDDSVEVRSEPDFTRSAMDADLPNCDESIVDLSLNKLMPKKSLTQAAQEARSRWQQTLSVSYTDLSLPSEPPSSSSPSAASSSSSSPSPSNINPVPSATLTEQSTPVSKATFFHCLLSDQSIDEIKRDPSNTVVPLPLTRLSVQDMLFRCGFTTESALTGACLSKQGEVFLKEMTALPDPPSYSLGSVSEQVSHALEAPLDITPLLIRIAKAIGVATDQPLNPPSLLPREPKVFDKWDEQWKVPKYSVLGDPAPSIKVNNKADSQLIEVRGPQSRISDRLSSIRAQIIADPSIEAGLKRCVDAVTDEMSIKSVMMLREDLRLPFVIDQHSNCYGADYSLFNLSNKTFRDISVKDFQFSGCNMWRCTFRNVTFMECDFTETDLRGATFINCKFLYARKFYRTQIDLSTSFQRTLFSHSSGAGMLLDHESLPLATLE